MHIYIVPSNSHFHDFANRYGRPLAGANDDGSIEPLVLCVPRKADSKRLRECSFRSVGTTSVIDLLHPLRISPTRPLKNICRKQSACTVVRGLSRADF